MDRDHFDALARALSSKRSRRGALAVILSTAILRYSSPVLSVRGGKHPRKQCTPGADPDQCSNFLYPVRFPALSREDYAPEICCGNGFCSCGGKDNCCGNGCFQTGDRIQPTKVFCCSEPQYVECPVTSGDTETCCEGSCENCPDIGGGAVTGTYRRR